MKKLLILLMTITLNAGIMTDITMFNISLNEAKNGNDVAQYNVGMAYYNGKGTQVDTTQAVQWFLKSAKVGNRKAMWMMANLFSDKATSDDVMQLGVKLFKDIANYKELFPKKYEQDKKLSDKYSVLSYVELGNFYKDGAKYLAVDDTKAVENYLHALNVTKRDIVKKEELKSIKQYLDSRVDSLKDNISSTKNTNLLNYILENENIRFVKDTVADFKGINDFYTINKYTREKARYKVDMTPLLIAIQNDDIEMARLFIKHGADINLANPRGETPLLSTMRNNYYDFAQELINQGAENSLIDNAGNSVLSYALKANREDIALQVLENKKFNIHQWLNGSVFKGRSDAYAEYIRSSKEEYQTFMYLHMAVKHKANKVIKRLIKLGLNPNTKNKGNFLSLDALGMTAWWGDMQSVKILLNTGANPYEVYHNTHSEGNYGLHYWGGLSKKYTLLSLALISQKKDENLIEYLLNLENANLYVENESEYFYFYLLFAADQDKSGLYEKVLNFFDDNKFKNREKIRKMFQEKKNNG